MPHMNVIIDKALQALIWLLPGLLILLVLIMFLSYVDRRPRRNHSQDSRTRDEDGPGQCG